MTTRPALISYGRRRHLAVSRRPAYRSFRPIADVRIRSYLRGTMTSFTFNWAAAFPLV